MTVPYSNKVATSSFSCFLSLLFRWRGSIYKLLWKEFAVFACLFYFLSFVYRFWLKGESKKAFERLANYCQEFSNLIPLAFVLGFYVSVVVNRFWEQYRTIPYPTRMAIFVSSLITGIDERGRMMRRTIMRYLCLSHLLTMAAISPPVKKRFPDLKHMTEAGFMLPNEQKILEGMQTTSNKYFVPLIWSASLVLRARKEGRIKDDFSVKTLIDEINDYRGKCGTLFGFDHVTVPIVYTQVVTIAVYMFFISCLMGRQFLENGRVGDLYFPFFTFLQFFFYMGWLKVAESLVNPFGEDDDDFDINGMIDKNLPISYLIVDEMHNEHPELIKDQYWDSFNIIVPYNEASQKFQKEEHVGSAANIDIPQNKTQFVPSVGSQPTNMGSTEGSLNQSLHGSASDVFVKPSNKKASVRKFVRSGSRLSNIVKSAMTKQRSKLSMTKEGDDEASISLKDFDTKDHKTEKEQIPFVPNQQSHGDLMFQMSLDESQPPPHSQITPHHSITIPSSEPNTPPASFVIGSYGESNSPINTSPTEPGIPSQSKSIKPGKTQQAPPPSDPSKHPLAPVLEDPESPEVLMDSLLDQLKEIREKKPNK